MLTFGEQLTAARKAKGMTQDALADKAGVTRQTISSWERGRTVPDIESVRRLSELLEVDLSQYPKAPEDIPDEPTEVSKAVEAEAAIVEPKTASWPSIKTRRRSILIAAVAALACAILLCALLIPRRPIRAPEDAAVFDVDFYSQQTPNQADKAYLTFENRTWKEKGDEVDYQLYDFTMYERNGIGFSVAHIDLKYESKYGSVRAMTYGPEDMRISGQSANIVPFGSLTIKGGFPLGEFVRAGVAVYGSDANGEALIFYDLIDF